MLLHYLMQDIVDQPYLRPTEYLVIFSVVFITINGIHNDVRETIGYT